MAKQLAYCVHGSGPLWVWIHGWGMNQAIWAPLVEQASSIARIATIDLPGFGKSSWEQGDSHFDQAVERVAAVVDEITRKAPETPIRILGWSMGGLFATALVAKNPERYAHLVWVASSPCFLQQEHWNGIEPKVLAAFQQQLAMDFRATTERFLAVQAMGSPNARKDIMALKSILQSSPEPHPEALKAGLNWLATVDLRETFEHLTVPTTRIYGKRDSLVPLAQAKQLNKPQDQVIVFNDSAHTPFLNEQQAFIAEINELST